MSFYDDLGVARDATPEEITKAHRKLAKQHHPDKGGDSDKFAAISGAYMVLRDPEKRQQYDRTGEAPKQDDGLARIAALLAGHFFAVLSRPDFERIDVIRVVGQSLRDEINEMTEHVRAFETERDKIDKAAKRLKMRGSGPNVLLGALLQQRELRTNRIAQIEIEMTGHKEALAHLELYGWDIDMANVPRPPASRQGPIGRMVWGDTTA